MTLDSFATALHQKMLHGEKLLALEQQLEDATDERDAARKQRKVIMVENEGACVLDSFHRGRESVTTEQSHFGKAPTNDVCAQ